MAIQTSCVAMRYVFWLLTSSLLWAQQISIGDLSGVGFCWKHRIEANLYYYNLLRPRLYNYHRGNAVYYIGYWHGVFLESIGWLKPVALSNSISVQIGTGVQLRYWNRSKRIHVSETYKEIYRLHDFTGGLTMAAKAIYRLNKRWYIFLKLQGYQAWVQKWLDYHYRPIQTKGLYPNLQGLWSVGIGRE